MCLSVPGHSEVNLCITDFMEPCISKMARRTAKMDDDLGLGDKLSVQDQSEVIRCISDCRQPCILKTASYSI